MLRAQPAGKPDARWKTRAGRCANILTSLSAFAATVVVEAVGTGSPRSLKSSAQDFRSNISSNGFVTRRAGATRRTDKSTALADQKTAKLIFAIFEPTWRKRTCRRVATHIARNCRSHAVTRSIPRSHIGGQHRHGDVRLSRRSDEQARR